MHASQISGTPIAGNENKLVISFSKLEIEHVTCSHDDGLVITIEIDGCDVKSVLIDFGNEKNNLRNNGKKEPEECELPINGICLDGHLPGRTINLLV